MLESCRCSRPETLRTHHVRQPDGRTWQLQVPLQETLLQLGHQKSGLQSKGALGKGERIRKHYYCMYLYLTCLKCFWIHFDFWPLPTRPSGFSKLVSRDLAKPTFVSRRTGTAKFITPTEVEEPEFGLSGTSW